MMVRFLKPRWEAGTPHICAALLTQAALPLALPGAGGALTALGAVLGAEGSLAREEQVRASPSLSPRVLARDPVGVDTCNLKFSVSDFPVVHLKEKETAEINFNNRFYLNPNVPKIFQRVINVNINEMIYSSLFVILGV